MFHLSDNTIDVCQNCLEDLKPKFESFEVDGYKALSIYEYDERIKALIYQLKGCFDIEISHVFLMRYIQELKLKYHGYVIVPIPSYYEDDERREFNHVEEMFKVLGLPMKRLIKKTDKTKQANISSKERKEIKNRLALISKENLYREKVLIVDDVYTTGATMKTAISLVEKLHPKKIQILVISKTVLK